MKKKVLALLMVSAMTATRLAGGGSEAEGGADRKSVV